MIEQKSFAEGDQGTLYLVPTPIGNLDDMTYRAVKILEEVELIAAEDTRNTKSLLNHFGITTGQISFHEHNKKERISELIKKLKSGIDIAQVSDAGTPSISDPGKELVVAAISEDIKVVALPGATASTTALIASGISPQPFYFYGFLERKGKKRTEEILDIKNRKETTIIYESPFRLRKTLADFKELLGEDRKVVTARELTKIHESYVRGTVLEVSEWFETHDPKGEFVIIISGNSRLEESIEIKDNDIKNRVQKLVDEGSKPKLAIKEVAELLKKSRNEVYDIYHDLKKED